MKIKDFVVGEVVEATLVVKSAVARETKTKKPYLALEFYDGTDTINANYWDWTSGNIPSVNSILDVRAQVTEWQGVKQLNIKAMLNNTTRHISEFAPASGYDVGEVYMQAYTLASSIKDDDLRNLTLSLLDELKHSWLTVPAAKGVHHAFVGGTLIHSCHVAQIAKAIAETVPDANVDLCIAGGMLHDIGKLYTYKMEGIAIDMTEEGQLYEHLFMGAELIGNYADAHLDCDNYGTLKKIALLRHIILSHHGKLEYGSPTTPACMEAHIVHHADDIDSTLEQIRSASRSVPDNIKWTERIYTLNNKPQLTPHYIDFVMSYQKETTCS